MFISQLFIYSREGHYVSAIKIEDYPFDATWTPRGNIVYTIYNSSEIGAVVVISKTGKVIKVNDHIIKPRYLSVSEDIIFLADMHVGVFQSTNDGALWTLVFVSHEGWLCNQVIKVTSDTYNRHDFWTLEFTVSKLRLGVYNLDIWSPYDNVTWQEINVTKADGQRIELHSSKLSYGGEGHIFLNDLFKKEVHVFLVNGRYLGQLLSAHQIRTKPETLALDKERQLLYIGQGLGVVGVFKLPYWERDAWCICIVKLTIFHRWNLRLMI